MSAQLDQEDWMMGGSKDAKANDAIGLTEAEVAQMAVEAYAYAWDKERDNKPGKGQQERFVIELVGEFEVALRERMGIDLAD
jgi:hypothetical protein